MLDDGLLDQGVTGKMMVIYSMKDIDLLDLRAQGMFADFFHVLGALKFGEAHRAAGVRVHFDTAMFVTKPGDNYWSYFFNEKLLIDPNARNPAEVHFNRYLARFGMLGTFSDFAHGRRRPHLQPFPMPHPSCGESCSVPFLNNITHRYIQPTRALSAIVDAFAAQHFRDKYVIGVHFRGTDKVNICSECVADYNAFGVVMDRVIANVPEGQQYVIFFATDETDALTWAMLRYPGHVVYQEKAARLPRNHTDGHLGAHKSSAFTPWEKGSSVVIDVLLLAKAKYLIKNRSSVSDAALLFNDNPYLNFSFILSNSLVFHYQGDKEMFRGLNYPRLANESRYGETATPSSESAALGSNLSPVAVKGAK
eukprot:gene12441-19238_t